MCDPVSLSGLAIAQGGANFIIGNQQAKEQAKFEAARAEAIATATVADAVNKFSALGHRSAQEKERAAREILQITRQGASATGTVKASAAASGVEGASVDAVLSDFARQQIARIEVATGDAEATEEQLQRQRDSVAAQGTSRLFESRPRPVARPNLFGALIDITAGVLQANATGIAEGPTTD